MTTTIKTVLGSAHDALTDYSDSPLLDAEVLLGHVLSANRARIFAHPDLPLSEEQAVAYQELINERKSGKPVAHLTGRREFWSVELKVNSGVLVPRPETELLVEKALEHISTDNSSNVLDLGTGSGAIAVAIALERDACRITATDRSGIALDTAKANLANHCPGRADVISSNWFEALEGRRFDVIVSNPPYVSTLHRDLNDPELKHEPPAALFSGIDGLDDIRTIVQTASQHLNPGGWLLLEHGFDQANEVQELLHAAGFDSVETYNDLAGHARVTEGQFTRHE
jgi:release factor glutamine methyltransferase